MPRRLPLRVTTATAALLCLSGCATFTNTGQVAEVDGTEISHDRYEEFSEVYFGRSEVFGTTSPRAGRVDAEQTRFLLGAMVRQQLLRNFAEQEGIDIGAVRDDFVEQVLAGSAIGESDLPQSFVDLIADVDDQVLTGVLQQAEAPDADELRAMYEELPASIGLMCARQVLAASEDDARAVLERLRAGEEFATLAEQLSIDPGTAANGGAIASPESACIPLELLVEGADTQFALRLLDARAGVPTDPIESVQGWHVFLARPWEEVADSVLALHQPGATGKLQFDGYAATAPVTIDPRYGEWIPLTFTVEALG